MKKFMHVAALACCLSLFLFAGSALAQRGGHGGGGGHMGGGGGHYAGGHVGGYGGGHMGGYGDYGRGYGGYGRGYGGYGYGYGRGYGLYGYGGYGLYGGGLGYWPYGYNYAPYYDTYASSPDYYYAPDYYAAPIANYDTYSPTIVTPAPYAVPADTNSQATLHVLLPDATARVFFDDSLTQQTGPNREFVTPPLTPDKSYVYTIRATWMENGHEVNRSQDVKVQAGRDTTVDFRAPPK